MNLSKYINCPYCSSRLLNIDYIEYCAEGHFLNNGHNIFISSSKESMTLQINIFNKEIFLHKYIINHLNLYKINKRYSVYNIDFHKAIRIPHDQFNIDNLTLDQIMSKINTYLSFK